MASAPNSPAQPPEDADADAARSAACGTVAFGADEARTELPLTCLRLKRAVEDPGAPGPALVPREPLTVRTFSVPDSLSERLEAFWVNKSDETPGVLLLAPQGWEAESADMGANGSIAIRLANPQDSRQYIRYAETGCVGCAVAEAALYSAAWAKSAEEQGYVLGDKPDFSGRTELSPNLIAYGLNMSEKELETHGVIYHNLDDNEGIVFKRAEVKLDQASHDTATAILNLFVALNAPAAEANK